MDIDSNRDQLLPQNWIVLLVICFGRNWRQPEVVGWMWINENTVIFATILDYREVRWLNLKWDSEYRKKLTLTWCWCFSCYWWSHQSKLVIKLPNPLIYHRTVWSALQCPATHWFRSTSIANQMIQFLRHSKVLEDLYELIIPVCATGIGSMLVYKEYLDWEHHQRTSWNFWS